MSAPRRLCLVSGSVEIRTYVLYCTLGRIYYLKFELLYASIYCAARPACVAKRAKCLALLSIDRECTLINRCELVLCGLDGRTLESFIDAFD